MSCVSGSRYRCGLEERLMEGSGCSSEGSWYAVPDALQPYTSRSVVIDTGLALALGSGGVGSKGGRRRRLGGSSKCRRRSIASTTRVARARNAACGSRGQSPSNSGRKVAVSTPYSHTSSAAGSGEGEGGEREGESAESTEAGQVDGGMSCTSSASLQAARRRVACGVIVVREMA